MHDNLPTAALSIVDLRVCYGDFVAVDGLNLHIPRGELFGLLGPNGAGKTSTIRVLIGQCQPTQGRVTLCGLDVQRQWERVKSYFGYVPDRENHFEELTGRRNLRIFCGLYGVSETRIAECLDLVELSEAGDLPVKGYSLGMRRKLLLARALLHRPQMLYLDEPTANLDIHSTAIVHRILRQLTRDGVTVLLTTHNMQEVEQICDRVAILCRGKLIALDSPLALRQRHVERKVDVILQDGARCIYDLDDSAAMVELSERFRAQQVASVKSREHNFHETFLKLTGTQFE